MNQEIYRQKITDFIDGASECAREMLENGDIGKQFDCAGKKMEETIREYPIESIVAGLIGGFIIGKLLK